jgi:hypothetical protein
VERNVITFSGRLDGGYFLNDYKILVVVAFTSDLILMIFLLWFICVHVGILVAMKINDLGNERENNGNNNPFLPLPNNENNNQPLPAEEHNGNEIRDVPAMEMVAAVDQGENRV